MLKIECRKLAQDDFRTKYDLEGNDIYWERCKRLKFDITDKWYLQNQKPSQRISSEVAVSVDHKVSIKENERIDKYLDLAWGLQKGGEHKDHDDTSFSWSP